MERTFVLVETKEREISISKYSNYETAWKEMKERLLATDEYFREEYDEVADENGYVSDVGVDFGINADSAWGNVNSGDKNYDAKIFCIEDLPLMN